MSGPMDICICGGNGMKKYKIGYTTGVFDLFHIGHLNILKKAKEQCEYLIVGVTTDEEVMRLKNKVPVISFEERIAIVESIKYVNLAVPEYNADKIRAWEEYKFDVIFKGSDWKGSQKWDNYEKFFRSKEVEVVYFQYTQSTSSTRLRDVLDKIINNEAASL
jgi:glycerol-3-phosphate cytidylyltransferase